MKTRYCKWMILAGALFAGCVPQSMDPGLRQERLRGVMDGDLAVTKSILVDNPGVKMEALWDAGDQIGVYGGSAENALFSLKAEDLSQDRKTADFSTDGTIPSGKLTAYAPYQKDAKKDGDAIVVTFPASQQYVTYNGVVQPDPSADILLGEGTKNAGLAFRNLIAVLKIGQIFEEETVIKAVEFRDLSGAAVAGAMKITPGTSPEAEITGDGQVITLDLGDGLEFSAGAMRPLFLIVPARAYPQGFEITFIDDKGGKTVKTAGTAQGKTLNRGVVYLIGDISGTGYLAGASTVLKEGATIMTPELLDKVTLLDANPVYLYDADGRISRDKNGVEVRKPVLTMVLHKDLHPAVGNWLIFDRPTETLPEGGVYRITDCEPFGDNYRIIAHVEENFAAPFEEVTVGGPLINEAGEFLEDGGVELDLASCLQAIIDENGNSIPFSFGPEGQLLFDDDATATLLGLQPETKGPYIKTFSTPKLTFKHSENNAEVAFGAQLNVLTKFAVKMWKGELHYIHFTANPVFTLSADFSLKAELSDDWPFHLITLQFVPITVAPGVIVTPQLKLQGKVGLGGEIKFSTSVSYKYDMGTYGISYMPEQGFTPHYIRAEPTKMELVPELGGFSGSLHAFAGLTASPYLSLYGMLGMGADIDFFLKFGIGFEQHQDALFKNVYKLFLTPEINITPSIASLGGYFTHRFTDLTTNLEFDPIWERYLTPVVKGYVEPFGPTRSMTGAKLMLSEEDEYGNEWSLPRYYISQFLNSASVICTEVDGIYYNLVSEKPTLLPWKVKAEVMTGQTNRTWQQLVLAHFGGGGASYWTSYTTGEKLTYTGVRPIASHTLMEIDSAQDASKTEEGRIRCDADFPNAEVRSIRIIYECPAIGKQIGAELDWNSGEPVLTGSPFATYWPETPEGPYFVMTSFSADYYDTSKWPGNLPVGSSETLSKPDGYYNGGGNVSEYKGE